MIEKYIESLKIAKASGEIDEKKFLFMRSHSVVNDALMNVTKGDYARFNERTYLEVYDEIQEIAEKKYRDELQSHDDTKNKLAALTAVREIDKEKIDALTDDVNSLKSQLEARDKADFDKKCRRYGWLINALLFGVPYIVALVAIDILKTFFTDINWYTIIVIAILVIMTIVAAFLFQKGKQMCFTKVEKHLKKKQ